MKVIQSQQSFVTGQEYSNDLKVEFSFEDIDLKYRTRTQILQQLCTDKDVVHVGFVDHNPESIEKKLRKNKWLHKSLCDVAKRCYGLDINEQGVNYVRDQLGYADVECTDILSVSEASVLKQHWDILLIPDVLEHQSNPVSFIRGFAERFKGIADQMIITVPNALTPLNFRNAYRNTEIINSDHRYWFTPYTLIKIINDAGLVLENLHTCRSGIIKPWTFLKNFYYSRHPLLRGSLVAIISL